MSELCLPLYQAGFAPMLSMGACALVGASAFSIGYTAEIFQHLEPVNDFGKGGAVLEMFGAICTFS